MIRRAAPQGPYRRLLGLIAGRKMEEVLRISSWKSVRVGPNCDGERLLLWIREDLGDNGGHLKGTGQKKVNMRLGRLCLLKEERGRMMREAGTTAAFSAESLLSSAIV